MFYYIIRFSLLRIQLNILLNRNHHVTRKITAVIPCFPYARQPDTPYSSNGAVHHAVPDSEIHKYANLYDGKFIDNSTTASNHRPIPSSNAAVSFSVPSLPVAVSNNAMNVESIATSVPPSDQSQTTTIANVSSTPIATPPTSVSNSTSSLTSSSLQQTSTNTPPSNPSVSKSLGVGINSSPKSKNSSLKYRTESTVSIDEKEGYDNQEINIHN